MELTALFEKLLNDSRPCPSTLTVKNYVSDLRNFIQWYEDKYRVPFSPEGLTENVLSEFDTTSLLSPTSKQRRIAALKKFFTLIQASSHIVLQPFPVSNKNQDDLWKIKQFKTHLHVEKVSALTVKNYVLDIISFKQWAEKLDTPVIPSTITSRVIDAYKDRLIQVLRLSPATVNRKLSSIRRYAGFMKIDLQVTSPVYPTVDTGQPNQNVMKDDLTLSSLAEKEHVKSLSNFPPLRLVQRFGFGVGFIEDYVSDQAAHFIRKTNLIQRVAATVDQIRTRAHSSVKHRGRRLSFHTTHVAFAVGIVLSISFLLINHLYGLNANVKKQVLGIENTVNSRILSFQGRLTDQNGNPIINPQTIRFAIYSDPFKDNGELWQERQTITPKSDGTFRATLGETQKIPSSLFAQEGSLYLGVKVGNSPELSPRKRLITTSYSADSQSVQGMLPVTADNAGTSNVILALDSSGNLSIGNHANPTFQATDGTITLSGDTTILTSNAGSNGDIQLIPDGSGMIDLQGPIHNSSLSGKYPGAVEIADSTLIQSSEPSNTSLIVDNEGFGDLFAASSSGVTRFIINRVGSVGVGTANPQTTLDVNGSVSISGTTRLNNITYQWPSISGRNGYVLTTDGVGNLTWTDSSDLPGAGFVNDPSAVYSADANKNVLIGATSATSAAVFAFLVNNDSSPATANFNANLIFSGSRTIAAAAMQPLQLGNPDTGSVNFLNTGNIGIGTTTPQFKLDVQSIQANTTISRIFNADTGTQADGLTVQLGNSSSTVASTNHFVNFVTSGAGQVGAITGNGSNGVTYATGSVADFAEYLKKDPAESIPFGSLVCINNSNVVTACTSGGHIIGAASERPAFLGGVNQGDNTIAVGLVGQISVKISTENGSLAAGDPITASSLPGVGEKATTAGFIIGHALTSSDQAINGEINVLVQPGWYDPDVYLTQSGELHVNGDQTASALNPVLNNSQTTYSVTFDGQVINRVANLAQATIGTIYSGLIDAQHIIVHGSLEAESIVTKQLSVTSDNILVSGVSLKDYILRVASESLPFQLVDGKSQVFADQVSSNIISPLANDSHIALDLSNSKLEIKKDASSSAVTSFDNQGNATFSGTLTAQSASVNDVQTHDASISGTLTADTIIANSIQGLDEKVATIAANYINQTQKPITMPTPTPTTDTPTNVLHATSDITDSTGSIASVSAQFGTFQQSLIAFGTTTLEDATVMNQLSIGTGFIIGENSIDTLGQDLNIQSLRQGNISFMAGLIKIDKSGNLSVSGNATFAQNVNVRGDLSAHIISPLPNSNLTVKLGTKSDGSGQSLRVTNSTKTTVFSVNNQGDVYATGSAFFARDLVASGAALLSKLNILPAQVEAVSNTEVIAHGSAGTTTLKAYEREITIDTPAVTANSLIYITPQGNTNNQVLYLERQVPGKSFTVGVEQSTTNDIPFNWIIVN